MKPYDTIFVAAVIVTLVGVAVAVLRNQPAAPPALPVREAAAPMPKAVEEKPAPEARPAPEAPPPPSDAKPAEAIAEAPAEAAPEAPKTKSRREMILGSWNMSEGGQTATMTFNADGSLNISVSNAPPEMPQMSATYSWDSDDHITINISMTLPDGNTHNDSSGATIVELTEDRLVMRDDRMSMERTLTR